MIEYSYDPPYNLWSGNRSDTLNKWKINYKGSIATASALPEKGDFKGDTYNVLEDGSNYMWNGSSWDKLDANVYVGATATADGVQGLVPSATSSQMYSLLTGGGVWSSISDLGIASNNSVVHITGDEEIAGKKTIKDTRVAFKSDSIEKGVTPDNNYTCGLVFEDKNGSVLNYIDFRYTTTKVVGLRLYSYLAQNTDDTSYIGLGLYAGSENSFVPTQNNKTILGSSSQKWKEVWSANGTIQTSDKRLKHNIANVPDEILDAWENINFVQYKFNEAIEEKGEEKARLHTGLVAQDVKDEFISAGLDVSKYGFFCYDEWDAVEKEVDKDGRILQEAKEAGNQYALRYEEALCVEAAYQRRRADRLEARIKALEEKLK